MMMERIISSGLAFKCAAGDSVYGDDRSLRIWLEDKAYVFAVTGKEYVDVAFHQYRASDILASLPSKGWVSAGDGSKGPRMYDWLLHGNQLSSEKGMEEMASGKAERG